MSNKTIWLIAAIVGLIIALVFALADVFGIGQPPFGLRQIIGTIVGVVILVVGIILFLRAGKQSAT